MTYATINFKTKKAFREAVESGQEVRLWNSGLGKPASDGSEHVEGPWYPEPHKWYAQVEVAEGRVTKVR